MTYMTRLAIALLAVLATCAPAQDKEQRKPSSPEERARFVQFVESLERDPLASDAKDKRSAALQWLIAVPDISVTMCSMPPSLVESKADLASEMFVQGGLSSGAFILKHPAFKEDVYYVNLAGMHGILHAYEAAKAARPGLKIPELESLLPAKLSGELPQLVSQYTKKCQPDFARKSVPADGDKETIARQYHGRGNTFFDDGYYLHALVEYNVLMDLFPNSSTSYLEVGQTYYKLGNLAKGEELLKHAIKLNPDCMICLVGVANLVDDAGRPGEALAYYERAVKLDEKSAKLHYNVGVTLQRLKRYEEAEAALARALALQPTYASPHMALAVVKRGQKDYYAAEQAYRQFLNLEREGARADRVNKLLKPTVFLDPKLKDSPAFDAYAQYGLARVEWIINKFRKIYPDKPQYARTADEEADALRQQVTKWREIKKAKQASDPELDRLLAIDDAGHLSILAASGVDIYVDTTRRTEFEKWCADHKVSSAPIAQRVTIEWLSEKW
jgi:tetratricopeptide (TPR) repeat protein